ncbi:interferon alpha/beta receptor 2-like [Silurus meridionalis]|uniref:Fibronectin type-III domain-containing protein n=1 Tax=Silurus meridionalis TaxID=175797 RepID=A0A8T0BRC0_SILME|nr:interferon alpha/beta receptor 2-like [Silurus meridionalis]KAF7709862.1 hypothetical protein HF521_016712 [Silurus meridionalis]
MNLSGQQRSLRVWTDFFFLIQAVQCSFPSPQNVSIVSFNLKHKLTWIPGPGTEAFTKFRVQSLNQRRKLWVSVKSCSDLQLGETCDLTESFTERLGFYQARVQAFSQDKESNWTTSKFFTPLLDTTLGPPLVSVTGCGNCLILRLSPPASMEQNHNPLPYIYQHYSINVSRTRDKAQFAMKASNGETLINYLEPGAEYCITAFMVTSFNNPVVPSDPQCSLTSPQPLNTVAIFLSALCLAFTLALLICAALTYTRPLHTPLLRAFMGFLPFLERR